MYTHAAKVNDPVETETAGDIISLLVVVELTSKPRPETVIALLYVALTRVPLTEVRLPELRALVAFAPFVSKLKYTE